MPSHESSFTPKRPGLASRHSSTTIQHGRSSSEHLATSATKQKGSRHVVGHGRLGPRIPSYGKNVNKLAKLGAPPPPQHDQTSPNQAQNKRNSSNQIPTEKSTHTNLKKNHSETSLSKKRNRSSKDFSKLTRPQSSKNLTKSEKRNSGTNKHGSSQNLAVPEVEHPTVRFDLGEEDEHDGWVEYSNSQSPATTRSNTRPSSRLSERSQSPAKLPDTTNQQNPVNPNTPPHIPQTYKTPAETPDTPESSSSNEVESLRETNQLKNVNSTDNNTIASRLLSRNVSFNAGPQLSSISARGRDSTNTQSINHSQDSNEGDLVSRFIHTGSSSGTPRDASFLQPGSHENAALDGTRQEKPSRTSADTSNTSGTSSPYAIPASRTQQKLWLERASTIIEQHQQQKRPPSLMAAGRFPSAGLPFQPVATDGTVHPQLKQTIDQTNVEYRRVRMYQHPLADALSRLQKSGVVPRSKLVDRTKATSAATSGDSERYGLSQSLKSSISSKTLGAQEPRKPRVMFHGLKGSRDDGEVRDRKSIDEVDFGGSGGSPPLDDAREICRRMWDQIPAFDADDS